MNNVYDRDEEPDEDPCTNCQYYDKSTDLCIRSVQGKNCFYIDESIRILNEIKNVMEVAKDGEKINTSGHCKPAE